MVGLIIALVIGAAAVGLAIFAVLRYSVVKIKVQELAIAEEISKLDQELTHLASNAAGILPETLLTQAQQLIKDANDALAREREQLAKIESKLDEAQKHVEEKEINYQEKRSAKESEEKKFIDLKTMFDTESAALISLEHKLSESMKNLDKLLSELDLTPAQQSAMRDLSLTLESAAGRLREITIEYSAVTDRIERLNQQHKDLEEEYTRLVEKQLGT